MSVQFKKATRKDSRLRIGFIGPAGSGKTYSSLRIAREIVGPEGRIAVIDTERGSASKYAVQFDFDVLELETFEPQTYINAILAAEQAGYNLIVIDSLSHAWMGKGGALELVDRASKRSQSGNSFAAWREVTPQHNALVDTILSSPCHVFVTMRVKTEYVTEADSRGRMAPKKVGLAPIQRDGLEYEFDVVADMDSGNNLIVGKTRIPALNGQVFHEPGADFAKIIKTWMEEETLPVNKNAPEPPSEDDKKKYRSKFFALIKDTSLDSDSERKAWITEVTKGKFSSLKVFLDSNSAKHIEALIKKAEDKVRPEKESYPEAPDQPEEGIKEDNETSNEEVS